MEIIVVRQVINSYFMNSKVYREFGQVTVKNVEADIKLKSKSIRKIGSKIDVYV